MADLVVCHGNVLVDDVLKQDMDILVTGRTIDRIVPSADTPPPAATTIDVQGCTVVPGFLDIHSHGIGRVRADSGDIAEFARLTLERGVTGCMPTFFSPPQQLLANLERVIDQTNRLATCPSVLGLRLEGPYLAKTGAANPEDLCPIADDTTRALHDAGQGTIKIWDVSPELPHAPDFIAWATDHGIVTSMAHTSTGVEDVKRAIDAGLRLVTHLYDTFDLAVEVDPGVYPAGVTDYIQIEDRLTVEIIPDGVHVHPYLIEKTFRAKGLDHVVFITDSQFGAGLPSGTYAVPNRGEVEITPDRGARRTDTDILSGSTLTQDKSFRNAVERFGKTIPEASRLCSRNPAATLGLTTKGYLAVGMDADIVVLDSGLDVRHTIVAGQVQYSR